MNGTDAELLARWRECRDAEAFNELVARYAGAVYQTCRRILREEDAAEDVAQECFLQLAQHAGQAPASLPGWLHVLATHRALNHLKADARRRAREQAAVEAHAMQTEPQWDDISPLIDEAIAELPEQYRVVVVGHFLERQTHATLAEQLGVSRQTVTYRIGKGIEAIRKTLRSRGVTTTTAALSGLLAQHVATAAPAALLQSLSKVAIAGTAGAPLAPLAAQSALGAKCFGGAAGMAMANKLMLSLGAVMGAAVLMLVSVGWWWDWEAEKPGQDSASPAFQDEEQRQPLDIENAALPTSEAGSPIQQRDATLASASAFPGYGLTVRVLGAETQQPLHDYEVAWTHELVFPEGEQEPPVPYWVDYEVEWQPVSDSDGCYRILLPFGPEQLAVAARATGHTPAAKVAEAAELLAGRLDLFLKPSGVIYGTAVTEDGAPIADLPVHAAAGAPHVPGRTGSETATDVRGRFRFHDAYGNVLVTTDAHGPLLPAEARVDVSPGQEEYVRLVLPPAAVVEGVVTLDSQPLEGIEVALANEKALTGANGQYSFFTKPAPDLAVHCKYNDLTLMRWIVVEHGMATEVNFGFTSATAAVTGSVLLDGSPLPQDEFEVGATLITAASTTLLDVKQWDGGYEVAGLQPGLIAIRARVKPEQDDQPTPARAAVLLELAPNKVLRKDFNLTTATGAVSGVVAGVRADDEAAVALLPEGWTREDFAAFDWRQTAATVLPIAMTDSVNIAENGVFYLNSVPVGRYTLLAGAHPADLPEANLEAMAANIRMEFVPVVVYQNRETVVDVALPSALK